MPRDSFSIQIDSMVEADMAEVLSLEAAAFPAKSDEADATGASGAEAGRVEEQQLRAELARPFAKIWVARSGATSAAKSHVVAFLLAWHVADELHVLNVATAPEHRRCGVARRLMAHALDFTRSQKGRLVLLEVRKSNHAAIALYRAVGFFAMGLRRAYYADGEDAIEMALLMDPATGEIQPQADEVRIDA